MFVCFLTTQIYDFGAKCAKASHLKLNLFLVSEIHEIHYNLRKCVFSFRTVYPKKMIQSRNLYFLQKGKNTWSVT